MFKKHAKKNHGGVAMQFCLHLKSRSSCWLSYFVTVMSPAQRSGRRPTTLPEGTKHVITLSSSHQLPEQISLNIWQP